MPPDPHRETDIHFDDVIIGSSVEALVTAYKYGVPVLVDKRNIPLSHFYLSPDWDLSGIGVDNKVNTFHNLSGSQKQYGMSSLELWNILSYRLNLMGLMPFADVFTNSFEGAVPVGMSLRRFAIHSNSKIINIHSKNTVLFDHPKCNGFGITPYYVSDVFTIKGLSKSFEPNKIMQISEDSEDSAAIGFECFLIKEGKDFKCYSKSIIDDNLLDDWKFSEGSIRMRLEQRLFWNISKRATPILESREKCPVLSKMSSNLDEIVNLDVMDIEFSV